MAITAGSLPVTLAIGDISCEAGTVDLPLVAETTNPRDLTVRVDMPELRRRIADLLREAAKVIEDGSGE